MKKSFSFLVSLVTALTFCMTYCITYCSQQDCCKPKKNPSSCCKKKVVCKKQESTSSDIKKEIIKQAYTKAAKTGAGCCIVGAGCCGGGSDLSSEIGYTKEELDALADANLGLGCGNPVSQAPIKAGNTVLDLGSGAGLDCFLAARKAGPTGKVIGIDMTEDMIKRAQENAIKYKYDTVEFRHGDIENLPVEDNSIDVVISNCVINLAPDKAKVFKEIYRVLKPGKVAISDVALTGKLTKKQKNDKKLLSACVSGAIMKDDYIALLTRIGFKVNIVDEDKEIGKKWFGNNSLPIASIKFVTQK